MQDERSDELDRIYDEISRLTETNEVLDLAASAHIGPVLRAQVLSDRNALETRVAAFERAALRTRAPTWTTSLTQLNAEMAVLEGRYDEAERLGAEMLEQGRRLGDPTVIANFGVLLFLPWREQGRVAPLEAPTRRAVEQAPRVGAWRTGLAEILLALGKRRRRTPRARRARARRLRRHPP